MSPYNTTRQEGRNKGGFLESRVIRQVINQRGATKAFCCRSLEERGGLCLCIFGTWTAPHDAVEVICQPLAPSPVVTSRRMEEGTRL